MTATIAQEKAETTMAIEDFFALAESGGGIYEIETPDGWIELGDLVKKQNKSCYKIELANSSSLEASGDHLVETTDGWVPLRDVVTGQTIVLTTSGPEVVVHKMSLGLQDTFDFEVLHENHRYYSNGISSHNTGKTSLGKVVCYYAKNDTVIWITPEMVTENSAGHNAIRVMYSLAEYVSPVVVVLEDIDLFSEDRDHVVESARLGALMNILDGVNSVSKSVTIAMTNRLELIEKALSNRPGRFDRVTELPPMKDAVVRKRMLTDRLEGFTLEDGVFDNIVKRTDNMTGAEIQEFVNSLNMYYISRDIPESEPVTATVIKIIFGTIRAFSLAAKERGKAGFRNENEDD